MVKVFVSSVSKSLEDIRRQIIDDLRIGQYSVVNMEVFGARPEAPLEVCLRELRTADVVVVIIGPRYGSRIPVGDVSYTHEEFREAQRRDIPVLAFRIPDAEDLPEPDQLKLAEFAEEAGRVTYQLTSVDRLSASIQASLTGAINRGKLGARFTLFQSYERFFAPQLSEQNRPLFNHLGPFVGRAEPLAQLVDFILGQEKLLILKATGGAGKSRILLEAAKRIDADRRGPEPPRVLFVDSGAEWRPEDINALPVVPTVLIFDDAHRRPDLDRLIAACLQRNDSLRFIVSCRPSAIGIVDPHVANLETPSGRVKVKLPPFSRAESEQLARDVLGTDLSHLAERLVRIADGNPLVIRIGAQCIAEKQVGPEFLERSSEAFRRAVLDQLLRDPSINQADSTLRTDLLKLLAIIGPINNEDHELLSRAAQFTSTQVHELNSVLQSLEKAGFIIRRGRLLRVSPDVLADHLLYRAAVGEVGRPTGFVDLVVNEFSPDLLGNILANAAELDWRAAATATHEPVLATTWRGLRHDLPGLTYTQRARLLRELHRAAAFAPEDVLSIAEWLIDHPDAPEDAQLKEFGLDDNPGRVTEAILELLGFIARHPDFTQRCLVRLWTIAEGDDRPMHPYPSHPRRKIADLLEYNRFTAEHVQQQAIDFVVSKLLNADRAEAVWTVDALGNALARVGEGTTSNRRTITFESFPLAPDIDRLRGRRNQVRQCLEDISMGPRMTEAVRAVHQLGVLLCFPPGLYGRKVGEAEIEAWLPETETAIQTLAMIASVGPSDVIRFLARRQLRAISSKHRPEVVRSVDAALDAIPPINGEQLFDIILGIPWQERHDDWSEEQNRIKVLCQEAAEAFWMQHEEPGQVIQALLAAIAALAGADNTGNSHLGNLVEALIIVRPEYAESLTINLAASTPDTGIRLVPMALSALAKHIGRERMVGLVRRFSQSDNEQLRTFVASALRSLTRRGIDITIDDLRLIQIFVDDSSRDVQWAAIGAIANFSDAYTQEAIEILVNCEWYSDPSIGEAVCDVLHPRFGIDPAQLSDDQIDTLLGKVEQLRTVESDSHHLMDFIAFASIRRPATTVEMLLNRIRNIDAHTRERGKEYYTPIPHNAQSLSLPGLAQSLDYMDLLRSIRNASFRASSMVEFGLPRLFRTAVTELDAGLLVLREWVDSNDPDKLSGVAHLLRGFDYSIVFSSHTFVSDLLDAAMAVGGDCLDGCERELFRIATTGLYSGSPGQPKPRDVSTKAKAQRLVEVYTSRPAVRSFYEGIVRHAEDNIRREQMEWESEEVDE